ncbi:hypothetical protein FB451DRAFT_1186346 [Mycena latifolia]|nr:hypothetical protein FB451DRAFT_1186346 [Mycena latifolia]
MKKALETACGGCRTNKSGGDGRCEMFGGQRDSLRCGSVHWGLAPKAAEAIEEATTQNGGDGAAEKARGEGRGAVVKWAGPLDHRGRASNGGMRMLRASGYIDGIMACCVGGDTRAEALRRTRRDTEVENARACETSLRIGETNGGGVTVKSFSEEESKGKGTRGIKRCPQRDAPGLEARGELTLVHEGCALGSEVRCIGRRERLCWSEFFAR